MGYAICVGWYAHCVGWYAHCVGWYANCIDRISGGPDETTSLPPLRFVGPGHHLSVKDPIGAEFPIGTEAEDGPVLVVADVDRGFGSNSDVYSYLGVWKDTGEPVCGVNQDGEPTRMIPLDGYWDESTGEHFSGNGFFTFACSGYVLAECAEDMGYKPWRRVDHVPLANHHQACTRMLRADYCGDGVSYTIDYTLINYWDDVDIAKQKYAGYKAKDWVMEAEWDANGANCLKQQRHPELGAPVCAAKLAQKKCGVQGNFNKGSLLMDEVPK